VRPERNEILKYFQSKILTIHVLASTAVEDSKLQLLMMLVFSSGGSKTDTFEIVKWIICERKRGQRRNDPIIMNTFRVLEKILNQ